MSKDLVAYKNAYPDLWKQSMYYEQFGDDWNGATGFDLWYKLDDRQKRIIIGIVCGFETNGIGKRLQKQLAKGTVS